MASYNSSGSIYLLFLVSLFSVSCQSQKCLTPTTGALISLDCNIKHLTVSFFPVTAVCCHFALHQQQSELIFTTVALLHFNILLWSQGLLICLISALHLHTICPPFFLICNLLRNCILLLLESALFHPVTFTTVSEAAALSHLAEKLIKYHFSAH